MEVFIMNTKKINQISQMYFEDYMSLNEIAQSFNVSKQYISALMKKAGYSFPKLPHQGFKDPRCREKEQFLEIIKSSHTTKEVGEKLGIQAASVRVWMRHHEISKDELKPYRFHAHHAWKGGVFEHQGYRWISKDILDPNGEYFKGPQRYIKEHRFQAAANLLNQPLPEKFVVHHVNGDRLDNEVENLRLLTSSQHTYYHNKANKVRSTVKKDKNRQKYLIAKLDKIVDTWSDANVQLFQLMS